VATGKISFFNVDHGYGFCVPDGVEEHDTDKHLFVHGRALARAGINEKDVLPGTRIEFDVMSPKRAGKDECQNIRLAVEEPQ